MFSGLNIKNLPKINMKLTIQTTQTPYNLLHKAGYSIFRDPNTRQTSYTRRLGTGFYPRFHIYVNREQNNGTELNLHLDQKRASYNNQTAHSGEYDSDLVKQEGERIKTWSIEQPRVEPKKRGFWAKLFG